MTVQLIKKIEVENEEDNKKVEHISENALLHKEA